MKMSPVLFPNRRHFAVQWGTPSLNERKHPLLNPVLRRRGRNTMIYSTSRMFRAVFLSSAALIAMAVISASSGPIYGRINLVSAIAILTCLSTGLYLERWVFDKSSNGFEKNLGIVFLHSRFVRPLDSLKCVLLYEIDYRNPQAPSLFRPKRRPVTVLSVIDHNDQEYRLDLLRGNSAAALRKNAEMISDFCEIPLKYRDS